ncbi:MAG TPA: DJ-1/PfpI family protein [Streptosporangiaceae bacterium]
MSSQPHRVAVLALDRVIPLDFAIPVQVFASSPYRVRVCAPRRAVRTTAGFGITASAGLPALARADTIVVPGFAPHAAPVAPAVLDALRLAHATGARMVSICTGVFALAQAGLLAQPGAQAPDVRHSGDGGPVRGVDAGGPHPVQDVAGAGRRHGDLFEPEHPLRRP